MSDLQRGISVTETEFLKNKFEDDDEDEDDLHYSKNSTDFTLNDSLFTAKIIDKINDFLVPEGKKYVYPKDRNTLRSMSLNDFVIDHILKSEKDLLNNVDINSIPETYWNKLGERVFITSIIKLKQGNKETDVDINDFKLLLETIKLKIELGNTAQSTTRSNKLKI
jgi:hypothetical protein